MDLHVIILATVLFIVVRKLYKSYPTIIIISSTTFSITGTQAHNKIFINRYLLWVPSTINSLVNLTFWFISYSWTCLSWQSHFTFDIFQTNIKFPVDFCYNLNKTRLLPKLKIQYCLQSQIPKPQWICFIFASFH